MENVKQHAFDSWYYKPCTEYTGNGLLEQMVNDRDYTSQ